MTALQDIVSTYVNALQQIENILPTAIGASTNANNNFSQIRYNLLDSGKISFSGLGATAFDNSVYQNLGQAQHLLIKLDNVNEATNHTRIEIQNVTHNYDSLLNLPAPNVEIEAIGWYGYSTLDIQNRI